MDEYEIEERVSIYLSGLRCLSEDEKIVVESDYDSVVRPDHIFILNESEPITGVLWSYRNDIKNITNLINLMKYRILITLGDSIFQNRIPFFTKAKKIGPDNPGVLLNLDMNRHWGNISVVRHSDLPWEEKKNVLIWRGAMSTGVRNKFSEFFTSVNHPNLNLNFREPMSIQDMLKYKYLLSLEGNDVASNLKWLMYSNSCVIMTVPTKMSWFLECRLIPYVHYVPVKDDLSDLISKVEWCMNNDSVCKQIGINGKKYLEKFLNPEIEKQIYSRVLYTYLKELKILKSREKITLKIQRKCMEHFELIKNIMFANFNVEFSEFCKFSEISEDDFIITPILKPNHSKCILKSGDKYFWGDLDIFENLETFINIVYLKIILHPSKRKDYYLKGFKSLSDENKKVLISDFETVELPDQIFIFNESTDVTMFSYHEDFKSQIIRSVGSLKNNFLVRFGDNLSNFKLPFFSKARKIKENSYQILFNLNIQKHWGIIWQIQSIDIPYEQKINKLIWRGTITTGGRHIFSNYFKSVTNSNFDFNYDSPLEPVDMLKYKFHLSLEGNDVASNLKWIMYSNSVVLMPVPKCESWFMEGCLEPYVHYVPLRDDLGDIIDKFNWCIQNDSKCKQISINATNYVKEFLNPNVENEISKHLILEYLNNVKFLKSKNKIKIKFYNININHIEEFKNKIFNFYDVDFSEINLTEQVQNDVWFICKQEDFHLFEKHNVFINLDENNYFFKSILFNLNDQDLSQIHNKILDLIQN